MTNKYSNFVSPDVIASAVQTAGQLGDTIIKGQQFKKFGGLNIAQQREAQRAEIMKTLAEKKKAEAEAKSKTNKILMIVGGSLLGLVVITFAVLKLKKK